MTDIFQEVSEAVDAPYISSLHTKDYRKEAVKYLAKRGIDDIPIKTISELIGYIFSFSAKFENRREATEFLKERA